MKLDIDKNDFYQKGAIAVSNFLSLSEVEELSQAIQEALPSTLNSAAYSNEYAKAYLAGIDLALKNSSLHDWVNHSVISGLAEHILSTQPYYIRDQYFEKSPSLRGTPLHQDAYNLPFYCREVITIWIPLTKVAYSPLVFKLNTHLDRSPYPRPNTYDWSGFEEASTLGLQPGDLSIHHGWTVHGSNADGIESNQCQTVCRKAWAVMYASSTEYALEKEHPHDDLIRLQDSSFLELVKRTRKEILYRQF